MSTPAMALPGAILPACQALGESRRSAARPWDVDNNASYRLRPERHVTRAVLVSRRGGHGDAALPSSPTTGRAPVAAFMTAASRVRRLRTGGRSQPKPWPRSAPDWSTSAQGVPAPLAVDAARAAAPPLAVHPVVGHHLVAARTRRPIFSWRSITHAWPSAPVDREHGGQRDRRVAQHLHRIVERAAGLEDQAQQMRRRHGAGARRP